MGQADPDIAQVSYESEAATAPISLTTPDGIALKLVSLDARSVTEGPLAFTELRLSFDNPENRTIEARFAIRLPQAASVSRFAMRINGDWQEGEMVEKQRARQIYEDFLHRRVDPALLEQGAGNEFTARVFPIPANGRKELIISYSQELIERTETLVPLRGLPEIETLNVELVKFGADRPTKSFAKSKHRPLQDFTVKGAGAAEGVRHGNLVAARIAVNVDSAPEPLKETLFLVDTSASRALGLRQQLGDVKRLVGRIAAHSGSTTVSVAAFDQEVFVSYTGPADQFRAKHLNSIAARSAMGASELYGALGWARKHCQQHKLSRVVIIGDGVVTAGDAGKGLARRIRALSKSGVERLDVLAVGGIRDDDALTSWVTAGLPHDGVVLATHNRSSDTWRRLNSSVRASVPITVEGAEWWWPKQLAGVQAGDSAVVYAEMKQGADPVLSAGAQKFGDIPFTKTARPLLARSWAQAKVRSLIDDERSKGPSEASRSEIVRLSQKYRVLSPYTGLLVLETQRDYDRYSLARDSLADILTVNSGHLEVVQRSQPPSAAAVKRDRTFAPSGNDPLSARGNMWGDAIGDSFGAGGLGLNGIGEGGGGRGEGIGLGNVGTIGHGAGRATREPDAKQSASGAQGFGSGRGRLARSSRTRPPRVRMGATSVSGRLPPEVIQRIVRQNFGRFRLCYEQALRPEPTLQGRVAVRFSIGSDGRTGDISATGPFPDAMLSCVAEAFGTLTFPQPEGGVVTVNYPIHFTPEGGSTAVPPATLHTNRTVRLPASTQRAFSESFAQPPGGPPPSAEAPAQARPYDGIYATIMDQLASGQRSQALAAAKRWHADHPEDVLAVLAYGETLEADGDLATAARAYGSIIDLYPSRADMRRYAGERLDRINSDVAKQLAVDTYGKAREQRPDHPTSHRLLAYALHKQGKHEQAFETVREGLKKARFRGGGVHDVMRADLGLLAAAWLRAQPDKQKEVAHRLMGLPVIIPTKPSVRFILSWETDANDVDLHLFTADGRHAYHGRPELPDGTRLYGDVTTGYGPELIEVPGAIADRGYLLQAHYYSRGAMGYGMGKVQIIEHDGKGKIELQERPFIVMVDRASVDLGTFGKYVPKKREEP